MSDDSFSVPSSQIGKAGCSKQESLPAGRLSGGGRRAVLGPSSLACYFAGAAWSWVAGAGAVVVEARVSRSFFRRLISTRPPLVRLVLASSALADCTGALPMPT